MNKPYHIQFNPSSGFIATYQMSIDDLPDITVHAMLETDAKHIASFDLQELTLKELQAKMNEGLTTQLVLYNEKEYRPILTDGRLKLIHSQPAPDDLVIEHINELAISDTPLHNGAYDLSVCQCKPNFEIGNKWIIKLIARRSGCVSDMGEYKYFPISKEASEAVWKGKMGTLLSRGLTEQQARRYIKYGLKVPFPYAEDIMCFVLHQAVEYGEIWCWEKPTTMQEMETVLSKQLKATESLAPSRKWVAYNMLLATLDLDTLPKET